MSIDDRNNMVEQDMRRPTGEQFASTETSISPELSSQIDGFVDMLEAYNNTLPEYSRRDERNYPFLKSFYKQVIAERNKRAEEAETQEYKDAEKLAEEQFPVPPYLVLCMDGRVLPPLIFGMTYGIGGSIRVPGGILPEFDRGKDGRYFLRPNSVYAERVESALEKSDQVVQVFDSHLGCAARNAEEESRGAHLEDSGLFRDILFKKEMAHATREYFKGENGDDRKVITIQTSFDPHNGFLFMGLGTDYAIDYARKAAKSGEEPEFTQEVRDDLVEQGKVISTASLAQNLSGIFEKYADFNMDWINGFVPTAVNFWESIAKMKEEARPIIEKQLLAVYPRLSTDDKLYKLELEERTILLLTNAFSGYMLNKVRVPEYEDVYNEYAVNNQYAYGDHTEQFIKVYEGGQPLYKTSAFVLFSLYEKSLPENIELAAKLVRKNRADGRVSDPTSAFKDGRDFEKAVVPVVVHEIVRDQLSDSEWGNLANIKWSDLPSNWDTTTDDKFREYLLKKGITDYSIMQNINNLRRRMAVLYDPSIPLASHLIDQFKVALPTIIGKNRKNYFVVPFVKLGYEEMEKAA